MSRNYEKEAEWAKQKYSRLYIMIDKDLGEKFKAKAKEQNKSINSITKELIEKYLKN